MRANVTLSPVRKGKRRLLESCAIGAGLIALAYGGPAMAQVAGSALTPPGTITITTDTVGHSTTVGVTDAQTIINWVPTDTAPTGGAIDFLPAGSTWNFSGNGSSNYVVLNRFVNGAGGSLSRQIALNGAINSTDSPVSGAQGGSIWFYNAGGILIGSSGVINVGSLVLTASDIDTSGGDLFGTDGSIRFMPTTPGSLAAVTVNGQINANQALAAPGSSYVALVAPRVTQSGLVSVNGSAAYVAAEAANIRINAGLFDIDVLTGTSGGQALVHTGTTTGPEQDATGQAQRIYMVAIPKNDAVSMLVSGIVGYQDATGATVKGDGSIILSAGYNVENGVIAGTPVNGTAANITVNDTIFSSDVTAHASGDFLGQPLLDIPPPPPPTSLPPPNPSGRIVALGDANFIGDTSATLSINTGRLVAVGGNLIVQSGGTATTPGNAAIDINGGGLLVQGITSILAPGFFGTATGDTQGGNASLSISAGGQFIATGGLNVSADAFGGVDDAEIANGDGRGGSATILIAGANPAGTVSSLSGGDINVHANGYGALPSSGPDIADAGGAGFGGNAAIRVQNGGSLSTTDNVTVEANGQGGFGLAQSGNGTGGTALIEITGTGATLQAGTVAINATGIGGGGLAFDPTLGPRASQNGGDGVGGSATLRFDADGASTIGLGDTMLDVSGTGGDGGDFSTPAGENATGGNARGGNAAIVKAGANTAQLVSLRVDASAESGAAYSGSGTTGLTGDAQGGGIDVSTTGAGSVLNFSGDTVILDASGTASSAGRENAGSGTGGTITVSATNGGELTVAGTLAANAFGGSSSIFPLASAGSGTGGSIDILADTGGTIAAGSYQARADATVVNTDGNNGDAQGGSISMIARGGGGIATTSDGVTILFARATDGVSADGSAATGGNIDVIGDGGRINLANTDFDASATSGSNDAGSASQATGGTVTIRTGLDADSLISVTSLAVEANGSTGANYDGFVETAGNAQGGTIVIDVQGGALQTSDTTGVNLTATGNGGTGGEGRGGSITVTQTGGDVEIGNVAIRADGQGGRSGDGIGGLAQLSLSGGTFTAGTVVVSASGTGGQGVSGNDDSGNDAGNGGAGLGGTVTIDIDGPAIVDTNFLGAYASGTGGRGGDFFIYDVGGGSVGTPGNGGTGTGGTATINLVSGSLNTDTVIADAGGFGGNGGSLFNSFSGGPAVGFGVGGAGGNGEGGEATIQLGTTTLTLGEGALSSRAIGRGGTGGYGTDGGAGGNATGGLAQAIIDNSDAGELALVLDSTASGGAGGTGGNGNGGDGGYGNGGISRVEARGANAAVIVSQANFLTGGTGGTGGSAFTDFSATPTVGGRGGDGGDGVGGTIDIVATDNATVTLGGDFSSIGIGGDGGSGADNPNTINLPGPDGILGTADDTTQGLTGGDGGSGGGGVGGTIHLLANGGTISSGGEPLTITANGTSGTGGIGGTGSGGNGAAGATVLDRGGRVVFGALATPSGPGQISLGDTVIQANGGVAGRIEMRTDGLISMASLDAEALGFADPTNNDTDTAATGIFFAATGGSISTTGNMTLNTDGSFGAYAQGDGQVRAGGDLDIVVGDQVDLRHEYREGADNATLFAAGDLAIAAGSSISGALGTLLGTDFTLTLQTTTVNGNIGVDRLDANNIIITTAGLASVEHAEATQNFLANTGSFRTGLNSLITGGDIDINAVGAVDLGNSTAGGHIQVGGSSIAFAALDAGAYVQLDTTGATDPGAITGTSIAAGSDVYLAGSTIDVGSITGAGSLSAIGTTGVVAIGNATVDGNIGVSAAGNITGTYSGGGDAFLSSGGNVIASVSAAGGFPDSSNPDLPSGGNIYVDAAGNVTLTDSSAAGMFGVNGQSVALTNASAGEDMLVLAQGTASLTGVTVGDDIDVRATGAITANGVTATGLGPDGFALFYSPTGGFTIGQGEGSSTLDGSDIDLQSSNASINATGLSAGDDIFVNAATTIALNGATTLGTGTTGGDRSIRTSGTDTTLSGLNAFSDVVVVANGAANITGSIRAGNDVIINANNVTLADIPSSGDPIDTIVAGRDIAIISAADISGGGTLRAGRNLMLDAEGAIGITSAESGDGGEMTLTAAAGIDADALYSRGVTTLSADDGDIRVGSLSSLGNVSVEANSLDIGTSGPVTFANIVTDVGDATIRSGNQLIVTNATIAGTARFDNSGEHMIIRGLTAAAAEFNANEMITMTNVSVTNGLDVNAGTTIAIDGVVTGRDISFASADIDIAATGRVGTAGVTRGLTLANNDSEQQTFVGGSGTKNGYHVDADELTRLFGTDIVIFAPEVNAVSIDSVGSAAPPDVIVDGFTMTGGASGSNLGANGSLTIRTPGKMRVVGNVQLTGLSNDNALNLFADNALEVILGQGTVRLLGANNAPGGQLNMASNDIIVATQAAINDIANATTTDAINTRLGQNDGIILDEGALFARGIRFTVDGGVYVQNSGTGTAFADRRGLTFGAGGLTVQTNGASRIVINGVHLGPNGQVTGLDTIPLLTIAPSSSGTSGTFDPRSTLNGCLIVSTGSCTAVTFDPGNFFPVQDVVEEETDSDGDSGDGTSLPTALITMRDLDPMTGEPLLDDPVTGAGNDDLWTPTTDTQQP